MTVQQAYKQLMYRLYDLYDDREAAIIADMVVERVSGFRKIDRVVHKNVELNTEQEKEYTALSAELLQHKPVQYVLHEAWFAGHPFYVDEHVLIPRPETEELVAWIAQEAAGYKLHAARILDIGTGSGCIPITLKKQLPSATVHALDISEGALKVAKQNAGTIGAQVAFHQLDILNETQWPQLPSFDIIVSNPPYIKQSEQHDMRQHVLQYEPHLALFVPDDDVLLFYKAIAKFGLQKLSPDGLLFFEINEAHGKAVAAMLAATGYPDVEMRKDLQGKDRMIKARRPKDD